MNDPNAHVYSHSTVVSMGPGQDGRPQYYEATNDVRKAGKVKEVRKTVRDSQRNEERMSIGHHIGNKGHVIEKRRGRNGEIEEEQRFHGINQHEAEDFDREWTSATRNSLGGGGQRAGHSRRAIQGTGREHRRRSRESGGPIIEEVDDADLPSSSSTHTHTPGGGGETKKRRGVLGRIYGRHDEESNEHGRDRKKSGKGPIIQEIE
jgi:hypothetical protein